MDSTNNGRYNSRTSKTIPNGETPKSIENKGFSGGFVYEIYIWDESSIGTKNMAFSLGSGNTV